MATFGNTASPTSEDETGAFRPTSAFVAPDNGTITSYTATIRFLNSADTLYIGLYADSGGAPGARRVLLRFGPGALGSAAPITIAASGTVNIVSGTTYWLAIASGNGGATDFRTSLSTGGSTSYNAGVTLPNPFGAVEGSISATECIYATYTPSGGGTVGRLVGGTLCGGVLVGGLLTGL